jgi:Carboxypeptidase regulatory-like domain
MLTQLYFRGRVFLVPDIAGATVHVKNTAPQVIPTATTNAQGRYTVLEPIVGARDVNASMPGSDRVSERDVVFA